jgi:hypothetical protein
MMDFEVSWAANAACMLVAYIPATSTAAKTIDITRVMWFTFSMIQSSIYLASGS